MTKVRSEYIKKLMSESHSLEEKLKDVAQSTINSILEEKTKRILDRYYQKMKILSVRKKSTMMLNLEVQKIHPKRKAQKKMTQKIVNGMTLNSTRMKTENMT